jgi:hypothetical protein
MHLSAERRGSIRFALNLEVNYAASDRQVPAKRGTGRTIDLSSSGLSFRAEKPLPIGQKLKVSIDWPVLLDGATKLQLAVSGVVVRTNGTAVGLQIERHQFRTRRAGLKAVTPLK